MDYLKKKEELQNKINEIDTYLKKKEELENKINEINTYWKDLETDYQKKFKEDTMNIKKTNH